MGQIPGVNAGFPEPCAGSLQPLALPLQGSLGVLNPLLQFGLFPFKTGGRTLSLLDFLLEKVVLLLQVLQLGAGVLDGTLLFLIGCNIALYPVEALRLLSQSGKLRLSLGEGAAEPAVHSGVQGKKHLVLFSTCHQ